jgi:predicted unusual protein kinase regulating ubiquinone biosynthesis (AarF/ABC1/UbiB family)
MKDAGIDTEDVVRTAMVALMEGAMVYGVFHGDLHGGNLFVLPTAAPRCSTSASSAASPASVAWPSCG